MLLLLHLSTVFSNRFGFLYACSAGCFVSFSSADGLHFLLPHLFEIILDGLPRLFLLVLFLGVVLPLFLRGFCWLLFRSAFLDELASTNSLMLLEPWISRLRSPIHSSFHIAVKGRLGLARSITSPNMLAMQVHLISEVVKDGDVQFGDIVDVPHDFLEFLAVSAFS